ncbi:MAG TPA: hypothetical protein ENN80_01720 [Candidatus Hydrogenedentes bacterium]|nr:hypothetical protein [Candidatus Hydrogenedentota bacterium]
MIFRDVLSEGERERIHEAAEHVLESVGFRVMHDGALASLHAAGAQVNETNGTVRMPRRTLRELLERAPSSYTIAWEPDQRAVIGGGARRCNAIVTDPWIIDYATRRPRRPCLADIRRHSIIAQKIEHVVSCGRMDYPVTDIEGPESSLRALEEHLMHYAKHYAVYAASLESFKQWLAIGRVVAEGKNVALGELMSAAVAVLSPLTLTEMNAALLLACCEHGIPVIPTVCPMAGTTSPYTHAATLVQGHAENLFLAALTQAVRPGNPFLYAFGPSVTDMRTGHDLYYTLDKVLWKNAAVQLGRACNLPTAAECGGTLTYRYDQQNGAEGMLFMLAAYGSGADLLCGLGSCANAVGMSAEMMVIQDAWLEAARFLEKGIACDGAHLGLDNLAAAGPGGHFLTDTLTLERMHSREFFGDEVFDVSGAHDASPSLLERAHERVEALVNEAECPLPHGIQEDLRRFFWEEYRRLR